MKQTVRDQIKKLADFSYPGLKTISGEDDFVELIKEAETAEDYEKAALAYLKFIVESSEHKHFIENNLKYPLSSFEHYVFRKTKPSFYSRISREDKLSPDFFRLPSCTIANLLLQFSFLWNVPNLKEAKHHAQTILDILLREMCTSNDDNLFLRTSQSSQAAQSDSNPVTKFLHTLQDIFFQKTLSAVVLLPFQILDEHATMDRLRGLDNLMPSFAHQTATILWKNDILIPAAFLFKKAIETNATSHTLSINERLDAYNLWGLCELEQQNILEAHKIYSSIIDKWKSDQFASASNTNSFDDNLSYLYGNMAYVLGIMADHSEDNPERATSYRKNAMEHIQIAKNNKTANDSIDQACLYTQATLYYDQGKFEKACKRYKNIFTQSDDKAAQLSTLVAYLSIRFEQLIALSQKQNASYYDHRNSYLKKDIENNLKKCRRLFKDLKAENLRRTSMDIDCDYEMELADTIDSCYQLGETLDMSDCEENQDKQKLGICLLKIFFCARRIQNLLRYNIPLENSEYGEPLPIAYYTTLGNAKYLLEKTVPVQSDNSAHEDDWPDASPPSKNLLTMMHVHYMNDPHEGNTLIKTLSTHLREGDEKNCLFIGSTYKTFRRKVLDKKYVFLKSFTRLVDQLNMWSTYASDRSSGSDSNGLCICVNPQTFLKMQVTPKEDSRNSNSDSKRANKIRDDYHLYRVAYIKEKKVLDKEGVWKTCTELVVDMPQKRLELLKIFYNALLDLFAELNKILASDKKLQTHESLTKIWDCLSTSLSFISFLFKDASYEQEKELRLVLTRPIRNNPNPDEIHKTDSTPKLLYVNPPHQIFVEKIILGPKVPNPDTWIPQLQHQLAEMWENWPITDEEPPTPKVRKSSISYR